MYELWLPPYHVLFQALVLQLIMPNKQKAASKDRALSKDLQKDEVVAKPPKPRSNSSRRPLPVAEKNKDDIEDAVKYYNDQRERHQERKSLRVRRDSDRSYSAKQNDIDSVQDDQSSRRPRMQRHDSEPAGDVESRQRKRERRLDRQASESQASLDERERLKRREKRESRRQKQEQDDGESRLLEVLDREEREKQDLQEYEARRDRRIQRLVSENHALDEEQRRLRRRQERQLARSMSASQGMTAASDSNDAPPSNSMRRKFSWPSRKIVSVYHMSIYIFFIAGTWQIICMQKYMRHRRICVVNEMKSALHIYNSLLSGPRLVYVH